MTDFKQLAKIIHKGLADISSSPSPYKWIVSESAWNRLRTDFNHQATLGEQQNIALKQHLADKWKVADREEKLRLAQWIIRDWGGIKRNSQATIRRYVEMADCPNLKFPYEGVSSYSKVLSIVDPDRFAVYDARVATSLNALQLLQQAKQESPPNLLCFPCPQGQNRMIEGTKYSVGFRRQYSRKTLKARGFNLDRRAKTYENYSQLLEQIAKLAKATILEIEMELFARALQLVDLVRIKLGPPNGSA